jgi:hypothetical protein
MISDMEKESKVRGYIDEYYPPMPTRATKHFRKNPFYQLYKLTRLNYKIMRIVIKGHS